MTSRFTAALSAPALAAAALLSLPACKPIETHNTVVIEQPKPIEVNLNLSGRLELVITDARKDLETITGQKPKRQVRPEDIGLPADAASNAGSAAPPIAADPPIAYAAVFSTPAPTAVASEDEVVHRMAARNADVRKLLSAHVVGEAHTGLLVEKGTLTPDQKKTVDAENADRTELYKLRAAKNGTTAAQAALAYYLERLGYAEKGDWVEKYNKATKQWEWTHWGE